MLSQAQEELLNLSDVKGGVGVEDDDVVEVGSDAGEAVMSSLITLTNHPRAALLPCSIASHSKRRVAVQKAVRCIVSLCTVI